MQYASKSLGRYYFCFVILFAGILSCEKNETDTSTQCKSTYEATIKNIVNNKCTFSGCHNQGSSLGDFTKYGELKIMADNGRIQKNVFELKIMPPANSTSLSEEEKQQLKCWLDNGASEQ